MLRFIRKVIEILSAIAQQIAPYRPYEEGHIHRARKNRRGRYVDFLFIPKHPNVREFWFRSWWLKSRQFTSEDQYWRRQRSHETTPIYISCNELNGKFLGSNGEVYYTTLASCDCMDFAMQNLPCKHIYRLLYDLDRNRSLSIEEGVENATAAAKIKDLSPASIMLFRDIAIKTELEEPFYSQKNNPIKELMELDLLLLDDDKDYTFLLNRMTKDEIILSLAKKTVTGYKPSWSKVKLINWIIENQQSYLDKQFKNTFQFRLNPEVTAISKKMYAHSFR